MTYPTLAPTGQKALDDLLRERVQSKSTPALFYSSTNAKEFIYENQAGLRAFGDDSSGNVNENTTLQLYSMTKLVTCLAALILVERGLASLDDEPFIEKVCPELTDLRILTGFDEKDEAILKPATKKITLRMLMSHSAGFSYPFTSPLIAKWLERNPVPAMRSSGASVKSITQPLVYEPGTSWKYSIAIDWVGIIVQRVSGMTLDEFFKQNIFSKIPGGMPDTTFYPRQDIMERLMPPSQRVDGNVQLLPPGVLFPNAEGLPGRETDPSKISDTQGGGGGLFGTTKDYLALLRTILSCDPRNKETVDGEPLLSSSGFKELFTPSLPKDTDQIDCHARLADFMAIENYVHPRPTAETVDHSIALSLNMVDSLIGRKKGSGTWAGAAKTQFWIDPTTGIAGMINTQLFASNPDPFNQAYNDFEKTLYDNLSF